MKIKRSDKQYTDIENFEEYEFTSCITYEMAIRHPRVIEILRYEFGKKNKPDNYRAGEDYVLFGLPDFYYIDYHFFNDINHGIDYNREKDFDDSIDEDDVHIRTFREYKGFLKYATVEKNEMEHGGIPFNSNALIKPWFKRPQIWTEKFDATIDIKLDLNLPTKELEAFIRHVKKTYDKGILRTPYDEFVQSIDRKSSIALGRGEKMADIFYIYDALLLGYSRRKIQIEIYNYYADKGKETRTMDYKTLKKYHEFAVDYIENKRYLEIATGKSLDEIKLEAFYR